MSSFKSSLRFSRRESRNDDKSKRYVNKGIVDLTQPFMSMLKKLDSYKDPSFTLWCLAYKGWGKTMLMLLGNDWILKFNKKRFSQILLAPKEWIEIIENYCPAHMKGRMESFSKLREIKKHSIVNIDEGVISINAAEALTKEMINYEKYVVKIRHYDGILWTNSQNMKIFRSYRGLNDIKIYKHLPYTWFIEYESEDPFLKLYKQKIVNLSVSEGLMVSGLKFFETKPIGYFNLHLKDYSPWLLDKEAQEEISKYLKHTNPDSDYEKQLQMDRELEAMAAIILKKFGENINKNKMDRKIKGFLRKEYRDFYYDYIQKNRSFYSEIINIANYNLYLNKEDDNSGTVYKEPVKELIPIQLDLSECGMFFRNYYLKHDNKMDFADIAYLWISGEKQRGMIDYIDKSLGTINNLIRKHKTGNKIDQNLKLSHIYEEWIAYETHGELWPNKFGPDIIYKDENNKIIGAAECKIYDDIKNTHLFYLTVQDKQRKKNVNGTYQFCKENGIRYFPIFFRNKQWGDYDVLYPIDIKGEIMFSINKEKVNYEFQKFNFKQFFNKKPGIIINL